MIIIFLNSILFYRGFWSIVNQYTHYNVKFKWNAAQKFLF